MFTGLIEELGRVARADAAGGGREIEIAAPALAPSLAVGDSVSVSGACQTVTAIAGERFRFYSMGETLRATTIGSLQPGSPVNLERALTPTSRLGGHFVTGHVDGKGRIDAITAEDGWTTVRLALPAELASQLVPKGSIAVDGISLTVGPEVADDACELFIIPHTLAQTTLGSARPGDAVNVETDLLGKYVQRYLADGEGERDMNLLGLLVEQGFTRKRGE
jgi:riboflavin synthase